MARKLKVYQTSLGFFDLAVAAPSMKAALAAWGSGSNLFHQGAAKQADDPRVIAAAMSKPGVVLKRAVGSSGRFQEHADLPTHLNGAKAKHHPVSKKPRRSADKPISDEANRKAARAFVREEKQRERARLREEAAAAKQRQRRDAAIATTQAALEKAQREHERVASRIEAKRAVLDKGLDTERARWTKQKQRLDAAVRRARSL